MISISLDEKDVLLVLKVLNEFCKDSELDLIEKDDIQKCMSSIISNSLMIIE